MAVGAINAGPSVATPHDATVTPDMQGLTSGAPAAPSAPLGAVLNTAALSGADLLGAVNVVGGGDAWSGVTASLDEVLAGGLVGGGSSDPGWSIVAPTGTAAIVGGGAASGGTASINDALSFNLVGGGATSSFTLIGGSGVNEDEEQRARDAAAARTTAPLAAPLAAPVTGLTTRTTAPAAAPATGAQPVAPIAPAGAPASTAGMAGMAGMPGM